MITIEGGARRSMRIAARAGGFLVAFAALVAFAYDASAFTGAAIGFATPR